MNIATLGGQVALVGVIGDDADGAELARLLESSGIVPHLVIAVGRPTTAKTRFMAGMHQLLRLDEETTAAIDEATSERVCCSASPKLCRRRMWWCCPTTRRACSTIPCLRGVLAQAQASGRMVIADPKRADFAAYRGATVLTPNEHEVRQATRIEADRRHARPIAPDAARWTTPVARPCW